MILPTAFYFTDEVRTPDPRKIIARLPEGTAVLFRHYDHPKRIELATDLSKLCKSRNLPLFIAGDAALAARVSADGVHLPDALKSRLPRLQTTYPQLIFSAACHSQRSLKAAERLGADFAFLSPIYATRSHPEAHALGPVRAAAMVRRCTLPVYALGGITDARFTQISNCGFSGFGAISLFE